MVNGIVLFIQQNLAFKFVHTDDGKQYYVSNPKPISIEDANQTFFDGSK